jgi:hypothetical protein
MDENVSLCVSYFCEDFIEEKDFMCDRRRIMFFSSNVGVLLLSPGLFFVFKNIYIAHLRYNCAEAVDIWGG